LVIFAPALPDLGRTTVDRIHLLNGTPITRTELSHDPKTSVIEDDIQKIMKSAFDEKVIHVSLADIQVGNIDFSGGRIFAFDASTNADMRGIIRAALAAGKRVLWTGTAAMADNLLAVNHTLPPVLAVITSLSSVTRDQVQYAEKQGITVVQYSYITEIAVGIPLMRLRGGSFDGLRVVTKAGAFGKEDGIFYALRKLREADKEDRR
jgi:uncharacterized protein YgbK (DUF1537 family)